MTKREVVLKALRFEKPPYVPWSFGFTHEARAKLIEFYGTSDIGRHLGNHIIGCGGNVGGATDIGNDCIRDEFGVVWDRSVDKDIGMVKGQVLPEPTMAGYTFPDVWSDALDNRVRSMSEDSEHFRRFGIGFSLYERAWTMRGMDTLMMDFYDNPDFVHELLDAITDLNIARVKQALKYDIDGVYFGDDWGQQHGLQMGRKLWMEFIYPRLKRMYSVVRDAGRFIFIHSCGDVDELFDDLVDIGLNCFNPFQPEVMDVEAIMPQYHGRLAFHGGMSTQRTLPYGTVEDVRAETRKLLSLGANGGYIFSPAHAVEGDVPVENMVAFIDEMKRQF